MKDYIGRAYSWEEPGSIGAQGIRTSTMNILQRLLGEGYRNISPILIDSAVKSARLLGHRKVKVHEPYKVMQIILRQYGFRDRWLFDVSKNPSIEVPEYILVSQL